METDGIPDFREDASMKAGFPLRDFAEPRLREILMLSEAINEPPAKGQLFQRLPKHMRRRQMSHHQSRLPSKLRSAHGNQLEQSTLKPPRRKHRRKPSNIAANFAVRSNAEGKKWLETHVWHAKRFHMISFNGYKVANRPTNKGFRASYRACRSHCFITDMSYMYCIELIGPEAALFNLAKTCSRPECGLTFAAAAYGEGLREGEMTIFGQSSALGLVHFLWRPKNNDSNRTLQLWAHPSVGPRIADWLEENELASNLVMMRRDVKFNRFRLVGPLASSVIADALSAAPCDCLEQCCRCKEKTDMLLRFKTTAPSMFPSSCVFGISVTDPRFAAPSQRIKSQCSEIGDRVLDWSTDLAYSRIWEKDIREKASENFIKDYDVHQARRGFVIPDTNNYKNQPIVPILLIQQSGCRKGFGAGWDIIVPEKWGMPFWRSLIMRGARPGGLQEIAQLRIETQDTFASPQIDEMLPNDYKLKTEALCTNYVQLPPDKRPNFLKLGIANPFGYQWKGLFSSDDVPNIVRDCQLLSTLNTAMKKLRNLEITLMDEHEFALVPVWLRCEKGRIQESACLYLPEIGDYGDDFNVKEPVHEDLFKNQRDLETKVKNTALAKFRKRRKCLKNGNLPVDEQLERERNECLNNHSSLLEPLTASVQNVRERVGFVTTAGFSHSLGCSVAMGYVSCKRLLEAVNLNANNGASILLLRNINSYQYFRCRLLISED